MQEALKGQNDLSYPDVKMLENQLDTKIELLSKLAEIFSIIAQVFFFNSWLI